MKLYETIEQDMINHLFQLVSSVLEIEDFPNIEIIDDMPFIEGGNKKSFGQFDGNTIKVISMNRHPLDVMRTLVHELVHWKQFAAGEKMDGNDGSEIENEANAVAGYIMRKFGEKYPDYFIYSLPSTD